MDVEAEIYSLWLVGGGPLQDVERKMVGLDYQMENEAMEAALVVQVVFVEVAGS